MAELFASFAHCRLHCLPYHIVGFLSEVAAMRAQVALLLVLALTSVALATNSHLRYVEAENADYYCATTYEKPPTTGSAYWQAPKRPLILISGTWASQDEPIQILVRRFSRSS